MIYILYISWRKNKGKLSAPCVNDFLSGGPTLVKQCEALRPNIYQCFAKVYFFSVVVLQAKTGIVNLLGRKGGIGENEPK